MPQAGMTCLTAYRLFETPLLEHRLVQQTLIRLEKTELSHVSRGSRGRKATKVIF